MASRRGRSERRRLWKWGLIGVGVLAGYDVVRARFLGGRSTVTPPKSS